jgi:hypothetical protein
LGVVSWTLRAVAVAAAFGLAARVHAQSPEPIAPPPTPAQVVRPPPAEEGGAGLRGGLDRPPSRPTTAEPPASARRATDFVQPPPANPRARTQRPTQGAVRRETQRDLAGQTRRRVYDPRASTLEQPQETPAAPPRRRRPTESDPFAPQGIRVGGFVLRPAVEAGLGFTTNANQTAAGAQASAYSKLAAEARLDSDWSAHALGLRLRIERQDFRVETIDPRIIVDSALTGRVDVTRDTQVDGGASYRRAPDASTTTTLTAAALGRPIQETTSFNAGLTQRFGRASVRLRGQYDQLRYGDTLFSDGSRASNSLRNVDVGTVTLRAGYDVGGGFTPFIEISANRRDFLQDVDPVSRLLQGSEGGVARGGFAFDLGPKLRGEIAGGYLVQRPREGTFEDLRTWAVDGFLDWSITPLTTLRFLARTGITDTQTTGAWGAISRDFTWTLEHALQRNVLVSGSIGLGYDDFAGVTRLDRRLTATLAATWRLNRQTSLRLQAQRQQVRSTQPGNDATTDSVEAVLRFEF